MPVRDYCQTSVHRASPRDSLRVVAQRMDREGVGSVVIEEDHRVTGVVTDRDIALAVLARQRPDSTPVSELVERKPVVVHADSPLRVAAGLMRSHGLRRLPVVDAGGKLIGVISRDDLLQLLGRELGGLAEALALQAPHRTSRLALEEIRQAEEVS